MTEIKTVLMELDNGHDTNIDIHIKYTVNISFGGEFETPRGFYSVDNWNWKSNIFLTTEDKKAIDRQVNNYMKDWRP
jgi:hypothetical protein